jgi:hypothetical protein
MHDGLFSHFPFIFIFLMHVIFLQKSAEIDLGISSK